ncbi:DNA topoisomerase I [Candidatus Bathycorpusculum sp.]|uniref:DNA topoisomerase I n=1 Tax=Candidatus Bathycorpusculum sp. TaxID=2994959 RepID=UPI002820D88F|nr:DNA topoisomerase I [Candidatus Termitimicrobium sp.]
MKHIMKSLKHNGIYVPPYDLKGFNIKITGQQLKLTEKSEPMAVAWNRRVLSTTIPPPDKVFTHNFMREFLDQLKKENPQANYLDSFIPTYLNAIENPQAAPNKTCCQPLEVDFSEVQKFILEEKTKKGTLTKEEKKQQAEERKIKRQEYRDKYGYAEVDGQRLEVANWTAEPSCLFAGRGDHPQRGRWKEGPGQTDITLNLSPDAPQLECWKTIWEPDKMYVAKWIDKLTGKVKYVWFSDTAFLKQNREKEKFQKAETLGKQISTIEKHILKNLDAKDPERRKVATVSWLILVPNMRVGDEKDPDEANTVGAITLRAEHIKIEDDTVHFDFLGKDSVRWTKEYKAPPSVTRNLKEFMADTSKQYLFEGIDSKRVSRFLSEKMPKLTAKVFRTWRCTKTVKEELEKSGVTKTDPDYKKSYAAKMANFKVAEVANHKRKIPPTFDQRVADKETNLKNLQQLLKAKKKEGKKTESLETRIERTKLDLELTKLTREYNLGTSLKSYIDPTAYIKWAKKVKFDIEKFYPKTLRSKFSWALEPQQKTETPCESECITP